MPFASVCGQLAQPVQCSKQMGYGQKRGRRFFVAGGKTTRFFEAAKQARYFIAVRREVLIVGPLVEPISFGWNDGLSLVQGNGGEHLVRVVGLARHYFAGRLRQPVQQRRQLRAVRLVPACQP